MSPAAAEHIIRVAAIVVGVFGAVAYFADALPYRHPNRYIQRAQLIGMLVGALLSVTVAAIGVVGWAR